MFTRRILDASRYSSQGLRACFRHEEAFRVEVILALVLTPVALWLASSGIDLVLLFGSMLIVLIVELLNSAIEAVVDLQGGERNELAGRAKDQGSAAVMLSMAIFFFAWAAVIWQRFI
ncbi:MAG: diacylglycerol kinase [Porticoccaceae bacterium]|nr:diacylglycerol kinase [Porticoccaceae bacterium]